MKTLLAIVLALSVTRCASSPVVAKTSGPTTSSAEPVTPVVLASEVQWEQLNPARGNSSPKAGTLWGDRNGSGPTGFLLRPTNGFRSPPHIHNVAYRGVVISGLIHNDDPSAEDMWMPAGSFWTQPAGQVHITAAASDNTLAYIEVDQAPFRVLPIKDAFDNGENPVNVDSSNIVWLGASNLTWVESPGTEASVNGPKLAFLWGSPQADQLHGSLVKLPVGFVGVIRSRSSSLRAVVIQGQPSYQARDTTSTQPMEPGSYFSSSGASSHQVSCEAGAECIIYVRSEGKFEVVSALSPE